MQFYESKFASGSLRDCYLVINKENNSNLRYLAKTPKHKVGYLELKEVEEDWKGNLLCNYLAEDFNKLLHKNKIYDCDIKFS